jgi:hypothetical protein
VGLKDCRYNRYEKNHEKDEKQDPRHAGGCRSHASEAEHAGDQSNDGKDQRPGQQHRELLIQ